MSRTDDTPYGLRTPVALAELALGRVCEAAPLSAEHALTQLGLIQSRLDRAVAEVSALARGTGLSAAGVALKLGQGRTVPQSEPADNRLSAACANVRALASQLDAVADAPAPPRGTVPAQIEAALVIACNLPAHLITALAYEQRRTPGRSSLMFSATLARQLADSLAKLTTGQFVDALPIAPVHDET